MKIYERAQEEATTFRKRVGFEEQWQYPFELMLARNRIWIRAELNGDKDKAEIHRMAQQARQEIARKARP